jgi:hypothetical protein
MVGVTTSVAQRLAERSLQTYLVEGLRFEIAAALAAAKQTHGYDVAKALSARIDSGNFTATLHKGIVRVNVDNVVLVNCPMWELRVPAEYGLDGN